MLDNSKISEFTNDENNDFLVMFIGLFRFLYYPLMI